MADNDTELISEVRAFTGYTSSDTFTDSDLQELVDIAKEELRAEFGDPDFTFYQSGQHDADRALFWFTCLATKVRTGEIGGISIEINEIRTASPGEEEYRFWITRLDKKISAANSQLGRSNSSMRNISRDDRSYSFDTP